jgi:phage shock protein C
MEPNKLYRSRTERVFAGVSGGLAEHLDTDVTLIRLLFVVLAFVGGAGIIAYIVLWIITPEKPIDYSQFQNSVNMETNETFNAEPQGSQEKPKTNPYMYPPPKPKKRGSLIGGLVLVTLGTMFLIDEFTSLSFGDLWPVILVVIGVGLLINSYNGKKHNP